MDINVTQQAAADRLIDKGVRVSISSPLFLRIFGLKTLPIILRATRYGTQIKLASKMLSIEIDFDKLANGDVDEARKLLAKYGVLVSRIVAFVAIDSWWLMPIFTRPLAWYIRTHGNMNDVVSALVFVHLLNSPTGFTSAITLTRQAAETTMTPRNVSQETQGS
jgi:hypothetical protein